MQKQPASLAERECAAAAAPRAFPASEAHTSGAALRRHGLRVIGWQSCGVMLGARRQGPARSAVGRAVEHLTTHWRTRRLATAFDLLDEIEVFAVKTRP